MNKSQLTCVTALLASMIASGPAATAGPLTEILRERQGKIDAVLHRHPAELAPAAKQELGDVLASAIDFNEMARQTLGDIWVERAPAEREAFVTRFRRLVRATWVRKPDIYRADAVEYTAETMAQDGGKVKTVVSRKDALTDVDYAFRKTNDKWTVVDYTIDGVSAVANYRSQFASIMKKKGWAGLLSRLDQRTEKLESEAKGEVEE